MGNGRDKSHDPDGLKDVGLRFKLAGYFSGPSKFSLKRGKKLRDFRDFLERDVERFLHSDATRRELNRAKLHRIKPEEIVKEAMEKIDWLNGVATPSAKGYHPVSWAQSSRSRCPRRRFSRFSSSCIL